MASLLLGPMLRHVSRTDATIWVETDAACTVEICGASQRTFAYQGHHFALVTVEGLIPGTTTNYQVRLDGECCWPPADSEFPPSSIRTLGREGPLKLVFGSCRAAAPHEPPYTLELDHDAKGRGIDALHALGSRMLLQHPDKWPQVLVLLGDQVYADESSPATERRIEERKRGRGDPPAGVVADFEEYTWLYHESWQSAVERWLFSVVPSAMVFDDHDMIDDWNISGQWVEDIRRTPWWREHVIGGLVSYWIYQHLGNLSPRQIEEEGLLARLTAVPDATDLLRTWALDAASSTPLPSGYRFSFDRHLGDVHLIVIDSRCGRVLIPGQRQMVNDDEWSWVVERASEPAEHILFGTSLPVFVPGGLFGLQQWNEARCDGNGWRARLGERLRRALDLEDWAAFDHSYRRFEQLLIDLATPSAVHRPPASIWVLSGDIHFAYMADIALPGGLTTRVRQVVSSPIRNTLPTRDRRLMRFAIHRGGRWLGRRLLRLLRRPPTTVTWELSSDPVFHNNVGTLCFDGQDVALRIEFSTADDEGTEQLRSALVVEGPTPGD